MVSHVGVDGLIQKAVKLKNILGYGLKAFQAILAYTVAQSPKEEERKISPN